jgi:hypothetical protein
MHGSEVEARMRQWWIGGLSILLLACSGGTAPSQGGDGGADPSTDPDASAPADPDGGTDPSAPDAAAPSAAPTWTQIYGTYFSGTTSPGHCARCHSWGATKSAMYSHLVRDGQIAPPSAPFADPNQSYLVWLGGNMPQDSSKPNAQAAKDLQAWAAAGAKND